MAKPFQVVVTDFIQDELEPEHRILGDIAEVSALGAVTEDDLVGRIEEVDAIILFHVLHITRRTLEKLLRCKLIVRGGVGFDNVDHVFARSVGIPVGNVPDYGSEEVADMALAMALSLARGVHYLNSRLRDGEGPWAYLQVVPLARLRGSVFGVIGLGRIGTAAALRAKALGMDEDRILNKFHEEALSQEWDERLAEACASASAAAASREGSARVSASSQGVSSSLAMGAHPYQVTWMEARAAGSGSRSARSKARSTRRRISTASSMVLSPGASGAQPSWPK